MTTATARPLSQVLKAMDLAIADRILAKYGAKVGRRHSASDVGGLHDIFGIVWGLLDAGDREALLTQLQRELDAEEPEDSANPRAGADEPGGQFAGTPLQPDNAAAGATHEPGHAPGPGGVGGAAPPVTEYAAHGVKIQPVTKPGIDETENEFRYRLRDPGKFEDGSFRRITIKRDKPRVFGIVGHLKGESKTTLQALRFPKADEWTKEKVRSWIDDHPDIGKSWHLWEDDAVTQALQDAVAALKQKLAKPDGSVQHKILRAEVREVDEENHIVEAVISSPRIDRDREIVEPKAFKGAKGKVFPLVAAHDYHNLKAHIGKTVVSKVGDDEVTSANQYLAGEGNDLADWGFKLAKAGLASYSIGFIPKEWTDADLDDEKEIAAIMAGKKPIRTHHKIELLEVSHVIVPSNRDAVQAAVAKGIYTPEDGARLEAMIAEVNARATDPAAGVHKDDASTEHDDAVLGIGPEESTPDDAERGPQDDVVGNARRQYALLGSKADDGHEHQDPDGDGKCDGCGQFLKQEGDESKPHDFVDDDGDGECDLCGKPEGDDLHKGVDPAGEVDVLALFNGGAARAAPAPKPRGSLAVGGARGLALLDDGAWDPDGAEGALRRYAGGPDPEGVNWARYRRGFVVYDAAAPEKFSSYRLPFAKPDGGTLRASRRGLEAVRAALAAGAAGGARGAAAAFVDRYLGDPNGEGGDGKALLLPPAKQVLTIGWAQFGQADELVLRGSDGRVMFRGAPVGLEDLLSRQVEHRLKVEAKVDATSLEGWTEAIRKLLAAHEEAVRRTVGDLPNIPAHIAEYPALHTVVAMITESILDAARRMVRTEIGRATGDVDAFVRPGG